MTHDQHGNPFFGIHSSPPVPYGVPKGDTLGHGRPLGKSSTVYVEVGRVGAHPAPVSILEVTPDGDPRQLSLTLNPPKACDVTGREDLARGGKAENFTGPYLDNVGMTADNLVEIIPSYAIIEWGAGGLNNVAEADFSNGLCVNLLANFVRVRAVMLPPAGGASQSVVYQLSAFVGEGYPKSLNAQRTILVGTGADVESSVTAVPRYAKTVMLCGTNPTFDDYVGTIKFYSSLVGPTSLTSFVASFKFTNVNPQPIIIPQGAYFFTVTSPLTNNTTNRAVFDLAI